MDLAPPGKPGWLGYSTGGWESIFFFSSFTSSFLDKLHHWVRGRCEAYGSQISGGPRGLFYFGNVPKSCCAFLLLGIRALVDFVHTYGDELAEITPQLPLHFNLRELLFFRPVSFCTSGASLVWTLVVFLPVGAS
ncbi:hypothetical protein MPH_11386 [Macrophomina phaseolina MS6]|uniref:Uncharacterized protein n=1 Tax=Macrophomina phaseolina (strain MS6) TaxID=1126212 RepID=K2RF31_MACPH|nr:hypothetical protein MPH_11386 [Macrophomina phaseolina MS6]